MVYFYGYIYYKIKYGCIFLGGVSCNKYIFYLTCIKNMGVCV